jgi:aminoglycoside 6'-N-acetyltransferase I
MTHSIRPALAPDLPELGRMRTALWPDSEAAEVGELLGRDETELAILVAARPEGGLCGYAEVATRPFADGCVTGPVGYLEGIWVDPDRRRRGIASALIREGIAWARGLGLREFASDAEAGNVESIAMHVAAGFEEAQRSVCFRMSIAP